MNNLKILFFLASLSILSSSAGANVDGCVKVIYSLSSITTQTQSVIASCEGLYFVNEYLSLAHQANRECQRFCNENDVPASQRLDALNECDRAVSLVAYASSTYFNHCSN